MTAVKSNRAPQAVGRAVAHPSLAYPFLILIFSFVGLEAYLLATSYREQTAPALIPEGTPPEKVNSYIASLTKVQRDTLIDQEKQRLVSEPLDAQALLNIGLLYALNGETDKSNNILLRAAERSLRDAGAQISAAGLSVARKDYGRAMEHIDSAIRTSPDQSEQLFKIVTSVAATPEGLDAVVKKLAEAPPWRANYFKSVAASPAELGVLYQMFTGLRDRKADVSNSELQILLDSEFAKKDYETAYFVWLDFLPPLALRKVGNIFDGQFDLPIQGQYFGWNIVPLANADISVGVRDGTANNKALSLNLDSAKVEGANVFQYMRLASGAYRLSFETKTENFKSNQGLMWRVHCVETGEVIGQSKAITDEPAWGSSEFEFTVPDGQCQTQELMLLSFSRAALDQTMSGRISFDNFDVEKLDQAQ
ncbi:MAG: hypothetical protein KGO94_03710 [Alphaproteobacteria bacterium]|nr:hypothetical protein [Alphaproteobacteria bacterium]